MKLKKSNIVHKSSAVETVVTKSMQEMSQYSGKKIENWDRIKKNVEDVNIMSIYTSDDKIVI